jgi:hypothetical protein
VAAAASSSRAATGTGAVFCVLLALQYGLQPFLKAWARGTGPSLRQFDCTAVSKLGAEELTLQSAANSSHLALCWSRGASASPLVLSFCCPSFSSRGMKTRSSTSAPQHVFEAPRGDTSIGLRDTPTALTAVTAVPASG